MDEPELPDCFSTIPKEGKHIDPVKLLQFLSARATVLAERTAVPGKDQTSTELLRGQRYEALWLRENITKVLDDAP